MICNICGTFLNLINQLFAKKFRNASAFFIWDFGPLILNSCDYCSKKIPGDYRYIYELRSPRKYSDARTANLLLIPKGFFSVIRSLFLPPSPRLGEVSLCEF